MRNNATIRQTKIEQLQDIYARLPKVSCIGKCQHACSVIGLFPIEVKNIGIANLPTVQKGLVCSKLVNGACEIYDKRPLVCRMFGVSAIMPCPFGCKPDRILTRAEEEEIVNAIAGLRKGESYISQRG